MDKNKENTFDVPAADIQDKITLLMGLPPEEASARLDKHAPPKRIGGKKVIIPPTLEEINAQKQQAAIIKQIDPVIEAKEEADAEDKAVDDIMQQEQLSSSQITENKEEFIITPKKPKGIKKIVLWWWRNKLVRNMTLFVLLAAIVFIVAIPSTRYAVLNTAGVRAGMQFQVVDKISGRPIKNVDVIVADVTSKTNEDGSVQLNGLPLGETTVTLKKRSFKEEVIPVTIGWGSNPFNAPLELVPTGSTFTFTVTDWLSGQPLQNVEISDGESIALSDSSGVAKLTIEPTDADITVTAVYNTYRTEEVTISADTLQGPTISMVPGKQDVFISKRQGKYDVYARYVDGKSEVALLPGSGSEQADTHLLPHPNDPITALVSSRKGERNNEGYILSNVYLLHPDSKVVEEIEGTSSERIRLIGWSGDAIVFVKTIAGPSAYTGNRQRVVAYDVSEKSSTELAGADYFTDVRVIGDAVYYVLPTSDGSQSKGLTRSSINGKEKRVLLAKNIWSVYRNAQDNLQVNAEGDEWYEIAISTGAATKLEGSPPVPQNRLFIANTSNNEVAWLEERDGKVALLVADKNNTQGKEVIKQSGISYPMRWLTDTTLLYTVANAQETAHYIVSTKNSATKKVGDVTVSVYADNLYYY